MAHGGSVGVRRRGICNRTQPVAFLFVYKVGREARPSQCGTKVVSLNLLPSGGGLGRGKREPSMPLLRKTNPNDWACEGVSQVPPVDVAREDCTIPWYARHASGTRGPTPGPAGTREELACRRSREGGGGILSSMSICFCLRKEQARTTAGSKASGTRRPQSVAL